MAYTKMKSWLADELQTIRDSGLYKDEKIIRTPQGSDVDTSQGEMINFCANNYLGLADSPEIEKAVADGLSEHGFGMASVRFICGTQDIHKALEQELSDWFGTEDTILYTSCFDANTGLFETILGAEDAIISDALNHASIIDGVRLCKAQRKVYKHADMADLEEKLKETESAQVPNDRDRRRVQHAGRHRASGRDMRPGGKVRRACDGRRLPRHRLHGPEWARQP